MTLLTLEPRTTATPLTEPFSLMRNLLNWDPLREGSFQNGRGGFSPSFDIRETSDAYLFVADMPGIREEDLDINLTGNRLSISGKRQAEARQEGESWHVLERSQGSFCRTFSLPEGVEANGVQAELSQGILTLTVPKVPEVKPRKINIKANG